MISHVRRKIQRDDNATISLLLYQAVHLNPSKIHVFLSFITARLPRGLYLLEKFSTRAVNATNGPVNLRLPYQPPPCLPLSLSVLSVSTLSVGRKADKWSAVFHPEKEKMRGRCTSDRGPGLDRGGTARHLSRITLAFPA